MLLRAEQALVDTPDALRRELREELGPDLQVGALLCVDRVSPHGPWDDLLNLIFDGGTLSDTDIALAAPAAPATVRDD